jgi:hypothetical protein
MTEIEWPDRDSREWLLGPRGASLEPWEEAVAHLPVGEAAAAVLCVPQAAPTIWMRDDVVDDLAFWNAIQQQVQLYDAGQRDETLWLEVLDGQAHLLLIGG